MDCVQTQQMVRPYMDGVLSGRELEEFLDHVERCPDCFGELEIYFSIHRTLNNVDEKGDYNYARKLRQKLEESRAYLRVRNRNRILKVIVILIAEICVGAALYGLFWLPGGYISRHHTEIIPVVETETFVEAVPGNMAAGDTSVGNESARDVSLESEAAEGAFVAGLVSDDTPVVSQAANDTPVVSEVGEDEW